MADLILNRESKLIFRRSLICFAVLFINLGCDRARESKPPPPAAIDSGEQAVPITPTPEQELAETDSPPEGPRNPPPLVERDRRVTTLVGTVYAKYVEVERGDIRGTLDKGTFDSPPYVQIGLEKIPIIADTDEIADLLLKYNAREVELTGAIVHVIASGSPAFDQQGFTGAIPHHELRFLKVTDCKLRK